MGKRLRSVILLLNEAGADHRHLNPRRPQVQPQRLAVAPDRRLAGAIGRCAGITPEAGERTHQCQLPPAARRHRADQRVDRVQHAVDIDRHNTPRLLLALALRPVPPLMPAFAMHRSIGVAWSTWASQSAMAARSATSTVAGGPPHPAPCSAPPRRPAFAVSARQHQGNCLRRHKLRPKLPLYRSKRPLSGWSWDRAWPPPWHQALCCLLSSRLRGITTTILSYQRGSVERSTTSRQHDRVRPRGRSDHGHVWTFEIKRSTAGTSICGAGSLRLRRAGAGGEGLVPQRIRRGNVNVTLAVTRFGAGGELRINRTLLDRLIAWATNWAMSPKSPGWMPCSPSGGVVETVEDAELGDAREHIEAAMAATLNDALDHSPPRGSPKARNSCRCSTSISTRSPV